MINTVEAARAVQEAEDLIAEALSGMRDRPPPPPPPVPQPYRQGQGIGLYSPSSPAPSSRNRVTVDAERRSQVLLEQLRRAAAVAAESHAARSAAERLAEELQQDCDRLRQECSLLRQANALTTPRRESPSAPDPPAADADAVLQRLSEVEKALQGGQSEILAAVSGLAAAKEPPSEGGGGGLPDAEWRAVAETLARTFLPGVQYSDLGSAALRDRVLDALPAVRKEVDDLRSDSEALHAVTEDLTRIRGLLPGSSAEGSPTRPRHQVLSLASAIGVGLQRLHGASQLSSQREEDLGAELAAARRSAEAWEASASAKAADLSSLTDKLNAAEQQLQSTLGEGSRYGVEVKDLRVRVAELEAALAEARVASENHKARADKESEDHQRTRAQMSESLDLTFKDLDRHVADLSELQRRHAVVEHQLATATREVDTFKTRCADRDVELADLRHILEQERAGKTAAEARTAELREELAAGRHRVAIAASERDTEKDANERLRRELRELRAREMGLEGHARDTEQQIDHERAKGDALEVRIRELQDENYYLRARVSCLEGETLDAQRHQRKMRLQPSAIAGEYSDSVWMIAARADAMLSAPLAFVLELIRSGRTQVNHAANPHRTADQSLLSDLREQVDIMTQQVRQNWRPVKSALEHRHGSLRAAFKNMDKDGAGMSPRNASQGIDATELRRGLREVHLGHLTGALLLALDKDPEQGPVSITRQEFTDLVSGKCADRIAARVRALEERLEALAEATPSPRAVAAKRGPLLDSLLLLVEEGLQAWQGEATERAHLELDERRRRRRILLAVRQMCFGGTELGASPGTLGIETRSGDAFAVICGVSGSAEEAGLQKNDMIVRVKSPLRHHSTAPSRISFLSATSARAGVHAGAKVELWAVRDPQCQSTWRKRFSEMCRSFPNATVAGDPGDGAKMYVVTAAPLTAEQRAQEISKFRARLPFAADPEVLWQMRCDPAGCAERMSRIFAEADVDGDKELDFDQFSDAHRLLAREARVHTVPRSEYFEDVFAVADVDNNGVISEAEFAGYMRDAILRAANVA